MKPFSLITSTTLVVLASVVFFSFVPPQDKPWIVPEAAQKVKNPTKNSPDNITIGKGLYAKHCKSCHGKNGEGDGPKAAELETPTGDFTSAEFKSQSDGAIYYKTTEGRDDMPGFKKKISSDEERWLIVHYLRTLEK
ncbi:MAG TPA: cytochrome c [Chryseosolibacter sp.]|nr:cytochrome c [Chryseosolibacter sp.]